MATGRDGAGLFPARRHRAIADQPEPGAGILELYRTRKDWIADLTHSHMACAHGLHVRAADFQSVGLRSLAGIPIPTSDPHFCGLMRENGLLKGKCGSQWATVCDLVLPELLNIRPRAGGVLRDHRFNDKVVC